MDIAGGNHCCQHITVLVADGMRLIGELPLVLPLHKHSAIRVCYAFCHRLEACLFPPCQLLPRGVVPLFPRGFGRIFVVIIEGLLPVGLPVRIDFCQQLVPVPLCRHRYFLLDFLFQVRTGLDVCSIYKHCRRGQCPRASHLIQYPLEYRLDRFLCKPMPEIIAYRGEMRQLLAQCVS